MSCGDEQSSTVSQAKVANKSLLIGIQGWEVFLWYCESRGHAWLTSIPSVVFLLSFCFFPTAAWAFCTTRSSLLDKSDAAVLIMCVCWGRWVLDKGPCGAPQQRTHEIIFQCGSVRETGLSVTASPRFLDCQLSGTLSPKCQVHIQICLPMRQCWKGSAL